VLKTRNVLEIIDFSVFFDCVRDRGVIVCLFLVQFNAMDPSKR